jgi:hypothetical protein
MELILAFSLFSSQPAPALAIVTDYQSSRDEFPERRCAPHPSGRGLSCTGVTSGEGEQDWRGSGRIDK